MKVRTQMKVKDVTGRDGYILAKALAYAVATIDALPPHRQEAGDQADMKRLLASMIESDVYLAHLMNGVQCHLSEELWRLPPPDASGAHLT